MFPPRRVYPPGARSALCGVAAFGVALLLAVPPAAAARLKTYALRSGPVGRDELAAVMGWPDDRPRADRVAATLVTDGLAEVDQEGTWSFPSTEVSRLS